MMEYELHFTLKPHPSFEVNLKDYSLLDLKITHDPLSVILKDFDMVFSSNTSSAGLDAFIAGLPVMIFLDGEDFNYSPLRGEENVLFLSIPEDLISAINNYKNMSCLNEEQNYFWFNDKYEKWDKVLNAK